VPVESTPSNFICPQCGASTVVRRTQKSTKVIRRERQCRGNPPHTFETDESVRDSDLLVQKSSGELERFQRKGKLEHSISLASAGALPMDDIVFLSERVVKLVANEKGPVVSTKMIGDLVLHELALAHRPSAMRYATVFLTSHDGGANTPSEFLRVIQDRIPNLRHRPTARTKNGAVDPGSVVELERLGLPTITNEWFPLHVVKRTRGGRPMHWEEDFNVRKMWGGVGIAIRHLSRTISAAEAFPDEEELSGAIVAMALDDIRGQRIVTSAQLSAGVMRALRSACPLGFLRFAAVAKGFEVEEQFLDECEDLISSPSPHIDLLKFAVSGRRITDLSRKAGPQ